MIFGNLFKKKRSSVKAYWWTTIPNFGDALAPHLLMRFADIESVESVQPLYAEVISIGSVLEHIPQDWKGYILGSGFLRENSKLPKWKFGPDSVKILALRGPLSAKKFSGNFALGDPGLLANELISHQEKKWDLGILPHWQDHTLPERFSKLIPAKFTIKVISPKSDPLTVIEEIASCHRLVTSSLHGMIVADAIGGIARRVEYCEKLNYEGGAFKFFDYSASIKTPFEFGKMIEPSRHRVNDAKFEIYDAYRELGRVYGKD